MSALRHTIAKPLVNSSGTPRKVLFDGYMAQLVAAQGLLKLVRDNGPHGRDYQGYPTEQTYRVARTDHDLRVKALESLISDLAQLASHVRM